MITYEQLVSDLPWLANVIHEDNRNRIALLDWINLQIRNGIAPIQVERDRHRTVIDQMKSGVHEALKEWVDNGTVERDDANELLDRIGAPLIVPKWKVEVDNAYNVYAIVVADTEEDAIQKAVDNMEVESITASVTISLTDDDDVEWNKSDFDIEDVDLDTDAYSLDGIDLSAEESDE